jgi:hypothetical protein
LRQPPLLTFLWRARYFAFFLEKDDKVAQGWLDKSKAKFEVARAREPTNNMYEQMIEQLGTAHEQRKVTSIFYTTFLTGSGSPYSLPFMSGRRTSNLNLSRKEALLA